jgi:hypothetical protein
MSSVRGVIKAPVRLARAYTKGDSGVKTPASGVFAIFIKVQGLENE